MGLFTTAHAKFDFDHVAVGKKFADLLGLNLHVMLGDAHGKPDGFDFRFLGLFLLLRQCFLLLVLEFGEINKFGYWRDGLWRNFHKIQAVFLGQSQCLRGLHDPDLRSFLVDNAEFRGSNLMIQSGFLQFLAVRPALNNELCKASEALYEP